MRGKVWKMSRQMGPDIFQFMAENVFTYMQTSVDKHAKYWTDTLHSLGLDDVQDVAVGSGK